MKIKLHKGDLPDGLDLGPIVAVDTETLGLNPLARPAVSGAAFGRRRQRPLGAVRRAAQYNAPNLKRLLADPRC